MTGSSGLERRQAREGQLAILVAAVARSTAGLAQRGLDAESRNAGRWDGPHSPPIALFLLVPGDGTRAARSAPSAPWAARGSPWRVFLAISLGAFLLALNYTTVANVLFMQAAAPMMAALLGWVLLSEPVDSRTWVALVPRGRRRRADGGRLVRRRHDRGRATAPSSRPSFAAVIVIARHRRE